MTTLVPKLCALAAAVALTAGLSAIAVAQTTPQAAPASTQTATPPSAAAEAAAASEAEAYPQQQGESDNSAAGPAGAPRPLETPILYVTSVEVLTTAADPKVDIVRVTGLTSSEGWNAPELVPFFYGKPADGILDLQFVAQSPLQSQKADGFMPVSALFTLEAGQSFKGVRVRASANAIQLTKLPGLAQTTVSALSGKDLIGKTYAAKGPAGPGVVTAAELPRGFRTIAPTHGVAGIVHNPNRLDLILDGSSKIVMAFWE